MILQFPTKQEASFWQRQKKDKLHDSSTFASQPNVSSDMAKSSSRCYSIFGLNSSTAIQAGVDHVSGPKGMNESDAWPRRQASALAGWCILYSSVIPRTKRGQR